MVTTFIFFGAKYLLFVLLGVAFGWFLYEPRKRKKEIVITSISTAGISFVLSRVASALYNNPRPFVTQQITPLLSHAADNGFPSDHALLAATVTFVVWQYNRRLGVILFLLTLCIGGARVLALVHHPIDILGSFGIALLSSIAVFYILFPGFQKWKR